MPITFGITDLRSAGCSLTLPCILTLAVMYAGGCASSLTRSPDSQHSEKIKTLSEGYSLLISVISDQKDAGKVFILRNASPQVEKHVQEIAADCSELNDWLNEIQPQLTNSQITTDTPGLPQIEAEARQSIKMKTASQLLLGEHFEIRLLISQAKATSYLAALCRSIADSEISTDRADYLTAFADKMDKHTQWIESAMNVPQSISSVNN